MTNNWTAKIAKYETSTEVEMKLEEAV